MEFVQKFTPPDFQAKNFTPSISPNFNSFSGKKTQKMSENGEIYTTGKNFTLPPALTAWTNSTSVYVWFIDSIPKEKKGKEWMEIMSIIKKGGRGVGARRGRFFLEYFPNFEQIVNFVVLPKSRPNW